MSRYEGAFALEGQGVLGWARQKDTPDPLWVELLMDDIVLDIGRADLAEPEGCGFWMPIPSAVLEEGGNVQVRVANTQEYIGKALCLEADKPQYGLTGEIFVDRGLTLSGWTLDTMDPDKKIRLIAKIKDLQVAETLACGRRYRPEQGDGHGFILRLPPDRADGREHEVNVEDEQGRSVPGSPVRICAAPLHAVDWLEGQNRLEASDKKILCGLLRHVENRLPGCASQTDYALWKKTFPVPKTTIKGKVSLRIHTANEGNTTSLLRKQQGIDFKLTADKAEYILLMQAEEQLHPNALAHMVDTMRQYGASLVYADSEDPDGQPVFKPAWDREAFFGRDYLGPVLVSRQIYSNEDCPYEVLRLHLALAAEKQGGIRHIPLPLSQELPIPNTDERSKAIQSWLNAWHPSSRVETMDTQHLRIRYALREEPFISIIIPTRDHADLLQRCLTSLAATEWPFMEILIVDNGSSDENALALLRESAERPDVRVLHRPGVFNYADLNNAAVHEAMGDLVCFLNNDTEALSPDWLREMASLLLAAGSDGGCVGAKLLWPNNLVQHGGVIVGIHQLACHVGNQWLDDEPGYQNRNAFVQQYSAVTAACMLTHKKLFQDLGGFDARRFPIAFNDVDYCLRLRAAGKKIFWSPHARLLHHESASRGKDVSPMNKARSEREMRMFRTLWGHYQDPFYNPNLPLSTVTEPFDGLAFPPRARDAR